MNRPWQIGQGVSILLVVNGVGGRLLPGAVVVVWTRMARRTTDGRGSSEITSSSRDVVQLVLLGFDEISEDVVFADEVVGVVNQALQRYIMGWMYEYI